MADENQHRGEFSLESLTFDTEAILAFFFKEEGGELVKEYLSDIQEGKRRGYMNIINITELYYILHRISPIIAQEKIEILQQFGIVFLEVRVDDVLWKVTAEIKVAGRLSLADAFAVATARITGSTLVVGSDKQFNDREVPIVRIRGF